jgi:hypothetical protein
LCFGLVGCSVTHASVKLIRCDQFYDIATTGCGLEERIHDHQVVDGVSEREAWRFFTHDYIVKVLDHLLVSVFAFELDPLGIAALK